MNFTRLFNLIWVVWQFAKTYYHAAGRPIMVFYCLDCHKYYFDIIWSCDQHNPMICADCDNVMSIEEKVCHMTKAAKEMLH